MLMAICVPASSPVNFSLVNCDPWSLLKISGRPRRERLLQRLHTELHLHRQRQRPLKHEPAKPVHHRHQVHEALRHPDVRDIRAPHLVDSLHGHASQQVRIDLVAFPGRLSFGFG